MLRAPCSGWNYLILLVSAWFLVKTDTNLVGLSQCLRDNRVAEAQK